MNLELKQRAIQQIYRTIQSANYYQFENGSLENLITNFYNIYKDWKTTTSLRLMVECRYSEFKNNY